MAGPGIRNSYHFRDEMASLPTPFVLFVPRCFLFSLPYNSSASTISPFWYSHLVGFEQVLIIAVRSSFLSLHFIQHVTAIPKMTLNFDVYCHTFKNHKEFLSFFVVK